MGRELKLRALDLFLLIAGLVIILQMVNMSASANSITFTHLGTLPRELVLAAMTLIIVLSSILIILAVLSIAPWLFPDLDQDSLRSIPLVIGAELIITGLSIISLSDLVTLSLVTSLVPLGLEIYCFGMISMISFVERMGNSFILRNVPNLSYPLFFLLLLPASYFITP